MPEPRRPELEDHRFVADRTRHVEDLSDELYLAALDDVRCESIEAAFGPDLREIRPRKLAIPLGHGESSLAVVEVEAPVLRIEWDNLYLHVEDHGLKAKLRVTDARFYEPDHKTVKTDIVKNVSRRLARGAQTYAMLGLAHAIPDDDGAELHWLQCNGICLADRAVSDIP